MKKLLLGAAFAAMGCAVALAQEGPKASNANPPAALQGAKSGGVIATDASAAKKKKKTSGSLKGNAVGPETGTAKDKASAPAR
jgi:opacity protein-like surface antigen